MYEQNPFGNPDGARADLKEIEKSFITEFPYGINFIRNTSAILNKRVIVGAKGSGKTVYLRKIIDFIQSVAVFSRYVLEKSLVNRHRLFHFTQYIRTQLQNKCLTAFLEPD